MNRSRHVPAIVRLDQQAAAGDAAAHRLYQLRDELIRSQVARGQSESSIAEMLGISRQRVSQIVKGERG